MDFKEDSYISELPERYTVKEVLGKGGMGVVYKTYDNYLKIDVALKILSVKNSSPDVLARFQREAKLASKLKHENIITILDFGILASEAPYMVLEYLPGQDLEMTIKKQGPLALDDAIPIFIQVCNALIHSHSAGVLHRDLKPANILLQEQASKNYVVKLLDFGIARSTSADGLSTLTKSGAIVGSPLYMSPEQSQSEEVDARSEIYSLGCVMFKTLTGSPPIEGTSILDTLSLKSSQEAPAVQDFGVEVNEGFESILARCLEIDPDDRFQSVAELKLALERNVDGLDGGRQFNVASEEISIKLPVTKLNSSLVLLVVLATLLVGSVIFAILSDRETSLSSVPESDVSAAKQENKIDPASFLRQSDPNAYTVVEGATLATYQLLPAKRDIVTLEINSIQVDKRAYGIIRELPIRKLILIDLEPVESSLIKEVSSIKTLKELHMTFCKLEDARALSDLRKLPNLERIEIESSSILGENLNQKVVNDIGSIPNLKYLILKGSSINAQALSYFPKNKHLNELGLGNVGLRENDFEFLTTIKVDNLSLRQNSVSPSFVRRIMSKNKFVSINLKSLLDGNVAWKIDTIKSLSKEHPSVLIHSSFGDFREGKQIL